MPWSRRAATMAYLFIIAELIIDHDFVERCNMATGRNVIGGSIFPSERESAVISDTVEGKLKDNTIDHVVQSLNILQPKDDAVDLFSSDVSVSLHDGLRVGKIRDFSERLIIDDELFTTSIVTNFDQSITKNCFDRLLFGDISAYTENILGFTEESFVVSAVNSSLLESSQMHNSLEDIIRESLLIT